MYQCLCGERFNAVAFAWVHERTCAAAEVIRLLLGKS
jgi:hypothetical protein